MELLRQLPAGLLRHHVLGVPVGRVRIADTGPPLVLAVRGFRTSHRSRQAGHRIEHRLVRVHTSK